MNGAKHLKLLPAASGQEEEIPDSHNLTTEKSDFSEKTEKSLSGLGQYNASYQLEQ